MKIGDFAKAINVFDLEPYEHILVVCMGYTSPYFYFKVIESTARGISVGDEITLYNDNTIPIDEYIEITDQKEIDRLNKLLNKLRVFK